MLKISVIQTDQTDCFNSNGEKTPCVGTGQDGESRIGNKWPEFRFIEQGETVTDQLTKLMWIQNANLPEFPRIWQEAYDYILDMNASEKFGYNNRRFNLK